jgi:hypothetical protein
MEKAIKTRFSIWSKGGTVLFDTEDYNEAKKFIDLKSTQLLITPGATINFEGRDREVAEISFLLSPYEVDPQCQVVVSLNE